MSEEEPQIRELKISDSYYLGLHLQNIKSLRNVEMKVGDSEQGGVIGSLETIETVLRTTNTAPRVVSQIAAYKGQLYSEYEGEQVDVVLGDGWREELSNMARTWIELLNDELSREQRIKIPNRGVFDYELLMGEPSQLFEIETWKGMDTQPKNDIAEACRALAVGGHTASVMVSLRAVEYYLRKWCEQELSESINRGSLGHVLDRLMEKYENKEIKNAKISQRLSHMPNVLSNVYYLKEKRNEVTHLDVNPTPYEAVVTLMMVAGTITEVCEELGEIEVNN